MAELRLTWILAGSGWADIVVADHRAEATAGASHITTAPEDFLTAIARLVLGERETRVQFEAEPTAFRWIFSRAGKDVWIRLLELPDGRKNDNAGSEIWTWFCSSDATAFLRDNRPHQGDLESGGSGVPPGT